MVKKKILKKKSIKIGKTLRVPRGTLKEIKKKAGGSNVGKYKGLSSKEFAGPAGGAPKGSFPINTRKRAKAALAYARNAPNPGGIRKKVHAKYPSLGKGRRTKK